MGLICRAAIATEYISPENHTTYSFTRIGAQLPYGQIRNSKLMSYCHAEMICKHDRD